MENTRFQFKINHTKNYLSNGKDELHLLISANKGVNYGELKKIASAIENKNV